MAEKYKINFVAGNKLGSENQSARSSFSYNSEMFTGDSWFIQFHFVDWPEYARTDMLSITIGSTSPPYYKDHEIVFHYIRGNENFVMALTKHPNGYKGMSPIKFQNYDPLRVIDSFINSYERQDPGGLTYMLYVPLSDADIDEKIRKDPKFIKWGVLKFETVTIANASMAVDELTDIPTYRPSYMKLV